LNIEHLPKPLIPEFRQNVLDVLRIRHSQVGSALGDSSFARNLTVKNSSESEKKGRT